MQMLRGIRASCRLGSTCGRLLVGSFGLKGKSGGRSDALACPTGMKRTLRVSFGHRSIVFVLCMLG